MTYSLIETSELAKVRDVLDRFVPDYQAHPIRKAIDAAKPVEVVALRWPNERGHHNYIDNGETWSPSAGEPESLYAIKEPS